MAVLYSIYATPLTAATTAAGFLLDAAGYREARRRAVANGAGFIYEFFHWPDLMPTTGTRDWTRFDALVSDTAAPLMVHVAPLDGTTKWYPSDISAATSLNSTTVTNPLTTLFTEMAARISAGRVVVVLIGNEIDPYIAGSAAARVTECAGFLTTMKTAIQTALGASTKVAMSFTYACVKDGTYASNNYGTVAVAGSYPVFTYYPTDPTTFVCYDFGAASGGMGDDFGAMLNATGSALAFGLQEIGCPSHTSLTNGLAGGGEATQQYFYDRACTVVIPAFASVLNFVTFAWLVDWPAAVVTNAGFAGASGQNVGSLGVISPSGHPKAGYDEIVKLMGGRDNRLIRPSRTISSYAISHCAQSF